MVSPEGATNGAGDSLLILISRAAALLTGIAIQSCLAWFLLPTGRGSYAVCVLFGSVVAVVFGIGLDKAVQYHISTSRMSLSEAVANVLGFCVLVAMLAVPFGLALMQLDLAIWAKAAPRSFMLMLCFAPFSVLSLALQWALIGARNFKQVAISTGLVSVLQLVAVVVFLRGFDWGVDGALLALVLSVVATSGYNLVVLRRKCGVRFELPRIDGMKRLLGYGSRYYLASIGYMANTRIGILLIAFFLTPAEIGYFAAAVGVIIQAGMIADSVETAVLPRMAEDEVRRARLAGQAARMTLLATGLPLAIFALFCRPIIGLLFSDEFLPSVPLILIVMPGLLLWSAGKILLAYFLSSGRPGVASWTIGAGIAVNVLALLLLLPRMELAGAALAMSLGFFARWFVAAWAFHAVSQEGLRSTWLPRRDDFRLLSKLLRARLGRQSAGGQG